jgi:hypothetical protein
MYCCRIIPINLKYVSQVENLYFFICSLEKRDADGSAVPSITSFYLCAYVNVSKQCCRQPKEGRMSEWEQEIRM